MQRVHAEREELEQLLRSFDIHPARSEGNFVFLRSPRATWLWEALAGLGIAVRRFEDEPLLENCLRITCPGNPDVYLPLVSGIKSALQPEVIFMHLESLNDLYAVKELRKQGLKLVIISDRLRSEIEPLLDELKIKEHFSLILSAEDKRQSTRPAQLRLTLDKLGASCGWLLTSIEDDIRASRAAGVVPIGVAAPCADLSLLLSSGASRVISSIEDLKEILP